MRLDRFKTGSTFFDFQINDNDNELDFKPKQPSTTSTTARPTRPRQLPKFSEKNRLSTKPTSASRKTYTTRNSVDHQVRRKTLRSTASPPPTTPLSVVKEAKFSAKFVKKEAVLPKGLYSSKRMDKEVEAIGVSQVRFQGMQMEVIERRGCSRARNRCSQSKNSTPAGTVLDIGWTPLVEAPY